MKKEVKYTILTAFLLVLTLQLVAADIRLTPQTPQAQFEGQVGQPIEYYIGVANKNNFTVTVSLGDASSGSTTDAPADDTKPTGKDLGSTNLLGVAVGVAVGEAVPESGPMPSDSDGTDENNSKLWLYIGGILLVIAIIIIVYFYIKSKKTPDYVQDFEELNQTVEQDIQE